MQSKAARALIALAAVAVIVIGFIVLGEDEAGDESSVTTATNDTTTSDVGETGGKAQQEVPSEPSVQTVVVRGGEPEGGVADLIFERGDSVEFAVSSDVAEEIHVHGYDVKQEVDAGGKTEFDFPADIEGIFEVELHGTGALIAELTVNP